MLLVKGAHTRKEGKADANWEIYIGKMVKFKA
jgi:hypothetical protein